MNRLLRSPLARFLCGGALLFAAVHGARALRRPDRGALVPVVVSAADVARLLREHQRDTGRLPSPADEAALVERALEEELLFREAKARGLDRDRSVRNWLVEQMRVLYPESKASPAELYRQARALGLDRTDLVVRGMLVQKMRLLAARENERPPDEATLERYYAQHRAEYGMPERVTLWQVYLPADAGARAADLVAELRRDAVPAREAVKRGQAFAAPAHLAAQSRADLARRFGAAFADRISSVAENQWSDPIASPWGWHLVWIEKRVPVEIPPLSDVRGRVVERWLSEQRAERLRATLQVLARRYPLRVESAAWQERRSS